MNYLSKREQATINQHYVPQFYLNNFSYLNKKGKPCIDVLDIDSNKLLRNQKIKNIASENYFYDVEIEKILKDASRIRIIYIKALLKIKFGFKFSLSSFKNLNTIENILADFESKTSPIFLDLMDKAERYTLWEIQNCFILNEEKRKILSIYLATQFQRTPKIRQTIREANTSLKTELIQEFYFRKTGEVLEISDLINEINDENIKHQHLNMLFTDHTNKIADIFDNMSWVFYKNTTDIAFITSDSPISTRATRDETLMSFSGINSPGVMILFPISKKLLLIMYEKELNQFQNNNKLLICDNPKTVEAYNIIIFLNCHRFLYGQEKELRKLDEYIKIHKKSTDKKIILANSVIPK